MKAHQEAFQLEHPLQKADFNKNQKLFVVGSAGNDDLIAAVDYWKQKGIQVEFVPYRIYQLGDKQYFEFYAHPYDIHRNPSEMKGILFDTNKIYDENLLWHMLEKSRVSAFGDVKNVVEYLNPKDIVFFSHKA